MSPLSPSGRSSTPTGPRRTLGHARSALPTGAPAVAAGLVVSGIGAYAFLAVTSRTLSPQAYAPLASLWSITFLIGPGSFTVLERELARRLSLPSSDDEVVPWDIYAFAAAEIVVLLGAVAALSGQLTQHLFGGDGTFVLDLAIAVPAIAAQYCAWGILVAAGEFTGYAVVGGAEGLSRLALVAALIAAGVRAPGTLGVTLGVAPLLAVLPTLGRLRGARHRAPRLHAALGASALSWLLGGMLLQAVIVNAGPVLVRLLGPRTEPVLVGRFLSGLVLVRVPLFVYNAAAATLLPQLTRSASAHRWHDFREALTRLLVLVGALGVAAVVGAATFGPALVGALFGERYRLGAASLAVLAAASAFLLVGSTLSVALTAAEQPGRVFGCWLLGVGALGAVCATPLAVVLRVELALLAAAATSSLAMGWWLLTGPVARAAAADQT